jgi:hypothetical protein
MPETLTMSRHPRGGVKDSLIVESLIELYTEKGIDLHIILDDPTFINLPTSVKIDVLKKYAAHISSSTSSALSRSDIRRALLNAGIGALVTGGLTAMSNHAFNKAIGAEDQGFSYSALAMGAGAGAVAGSVKSLMESAGDISARNEISHRFGTLAQSKSDKDAIKILALRNMQSGRVRMPTSPLSELNSKATSLLMPAAVHIGRTGAYALAAKTYQDGVVSSVGGTSNMKDENNPFFHSADANAKYHQAQGVFEGAARDSHNSILNKLKGMF